MGRVKISYYIVKRGRGFWNPSAAMKRAGFAAVPCGLDGPEAWAVAETWNKRWAACRRGVVAPRWPEGALGEAFDRFRSTETWKRKATKTRQEWEAMSRLYIMPIFGDHRPPAASLTACAMPKSATTAWPASNRMFSGLMSRWTTP